MKFLRYVMAAMCFLVALGLLYGVFLEGKPNTGEPLILVALALILIELDED